MKTAEEFLKQNYTVTYRHLANGDGNNIKAFAIYEAMEEYANQSKWISVENLLENFENGKERYNKDPKFRIYIECILRGDNVYKLLDSLL
jgi:hypothetical protein